VRNALLGPDGSHTECQTPADCQLGFYWITPPHLGNGVMGPTLGSQESGIDALTSALPQARAAARSGAA
jgi:hypothetical protein